MTQFCGEPGCGVLVRSGRCETHSPRARLTRIEDRIVHRWYTSSRWQRLRRDVLQAGPFCRSCRDQGVKRLAVDVDHIVKHDGDAILFWDRTNLQGLCKACHTRKTTRGG